MSTREHSPARRPRRVTVRGLSAAPREERAATMLVARALGIALSEVRALLATLPVTIIRS